MVFRIFTTFKSLNFSDTINHVVNGENTNCVITDIHEKHPGTNELIAALTE